jgi:hypothetical protein
MVLQILKPRMFNRLKKFVGWWVAELPTVPWSLRTSPSQVIDFTPFFMVYVFEVVLLTDLDCGAPRVSVGVLPPHPPRDILESARNTRFRQVWAAKSIIPYVLCGLYCL